MLWRQSTASRVRYNALLLTLFNNVSAALSPISATGTKLYDTDGNQFYMKGVAYSNELLDPLLNDNQCQIDAGLMKELGANTIRVYTVDNSQDHDGCMKAFESQGIYVWLDVTTPQISFNRVTPEWTMEMYNNWTVTIDKFSKYDNLLSFTVGNEVANQDADTVAAMPYVKAAIRDLKAYRNARGYRKIPLSYTTGDNAEIRVQVAEYLACGDVEDSAELYGLNLYSWCGNSSYYTSGYDKLYEQYQTYSLPVAFAETGCNIISPRDFADVQTMLGPVFQAVFSGAVVYEWRMEDNGFGIVEYPSSSLAGFPTTLDEYNSLKTVFSSVNPTGTAKADYEPSNTAPACPTSDSDNWPLDTTELPTIEGLDIGTVTARTTITASPTSSTTGRNTGAPIRETLMSGGDKPNGGLQTGAIAGIAVGAAAAVLIVFAIVAFLLIRRRRAKKRAAEGGLVAQTGTDPTHKSELSAQPAQPAGQAMPRQEMDAVQDPQYAQQNQYQQQQYGEYYAPNGPKDNTSEGWDYPRPTHEMEGSRPQIHEMHGQQQQQHF